MGGELDKGIPIGTFSRGDSDIVPPVRLKNIRTTSRAVKGVNFFRARLKNGFYRFSIAGSANFMQGLAVCLAFFERVNTPPHVGFRKRVARGLSRKCILLFKFSLKFQQQILHQHLVSLGLQKVVQEFQDEHFAFDKVRFRGAENLLEVISGFDTRPHTGGTLPQKSNNCCDICHGKSIAQKLEGAND